MSKPAYTHVAFADESSWNQGRFRSISLVSAAVEDARRFHQELEALRKNHGVLEYKWHATRFRHGIALVDFFFARREQMRVDVLVWDIEDARHADVPDRDDKANFARMYYHLLHNVLKRRWPKGARWLICPDEQKEVDWLRLEQFLGWKRWVSEEGLFNPGCEAEWRAFYNIQEIRCVCSRKYLLIQLADLFAGLAAYSYHAFPKYAQWKDSQNPTPPLFDLPDNEVKKLKLSRNDKDRLRILQHVRNEAGKCAFNVSLESSKGLFTWTPAHALNFWLYTPQHAQDKAPIKALK
jgi:hypothetical protein